MQMSKKSEMETLGCQVRMTFSTGVKNVPLNLNEVWWELDATSPKNCPAHSLSSRCHPPTFLLSTSSSSVPLRLSRNIHTLISGLWRPLWHLNQTSFLWGNISADVSGGVQAPAQGWWKGSGNHWNGKSLGEEALTIVLWKSWSPCIKSWRHLEQRRWSMSARTLWKWSWALGADILQCFLVNCSSQKARILTGALEKAPNLQITAKPKWFLFKEIFAIRISLGRGRKTHASPHAANQVTDTSPSLSWALHMELWHITANFQGIALFKEEKDRTNDICLLSAGSVCVHSQHICSVSDRPSWSGHSVVAMRGNKAFWGENLQRN